MVGKRATFRYECSNQKVVFCDYLLVVSKGRKKPSIISSGKTVAIVRVQHVDSDECVVKPELSFKLQVNFMRYDLIIIGAGAAGLAAAHELSNNGLRVAILEARERIGGRMFSIRDAEMGFPIELGAEFIHGRPPATFSILEKAGLQPKAAKGSSWTAHKGQFRPYGGDDAEKPIWDKMHALEQDMSLQELLDTYFTDERWREGVESISSFVQGFDAARPDRVSIHWLLKEAEAAEKIGGETNHRLSVPYDSVPRWLLDNSKLENVDLRLNTIVKMVRWQKGHVEVETSSAAVFQAEKLLITLPVGVLQAADGVEFAPALTQKAWALDHIDMGQTVKLVLRFRERFWEDSLPSVQAGELKGMSYLGSPNTPVRVWWTQHPNPSPTLTAWIGALEAAKLTSESDTFIVERIIGILAAVLGVERGWIDSQLQEWHFHNWKADPFARGVYSYVAAGGVDAVRQLAEPLDNTLFFAGEATDLGWHIGTVHGAIASGERAAREILAETHS